MNQSQEVNLGKLPDKDAKRDAAHVAYIPVVSLTDLNPGEKVHAYFNSDNGYFEAFAREKYPTGIIDPFLMEPVKAGQLVYVVLFPNTITDMAHHWSHPAFPDRYKCETDFKKLKEAKDFIRSFAEELDITFEEALNAGDEYLAMGVFLILNYDTPEFVSDLAPSYWDAWSILRKRPIPQDTDGSPFSCSC